MNTPWVFAFDFDGVIADSSADYVDAINKVAKPLGASRLMTAALLSEMPEYKHECSAELVGIPNALFDEFSQNLKSYFHQERSILLHDEMRSVLRTLDEYGDVVIVSANKESVIASALAQLRTDVRAIYAERSAAAKSEILTHLSQRGRVVMVGDTLSDCRAAAQANVEAVAVTWGWQGIAHLAQTGVPLVQSPIELQKYLLNWCEGRCAYPEDSFDKSNE